MKCYSGQGWVYTDGEKLLAQQCPKELHIGCRLCSDLMKFGSCPGRKKLVVDKEEFLRRRQKWVDMKGEVLKEYRERNKAVEKAKEDSIPESWKRRLK